MDIIKKYVLNKSFGLGAILTVGVFSQYIFGSDNLAEQLSEKILKLTTGTDIDFSPESQESKDEKLKELVELIKQLERNNPHI